VALRDRLTDAVKALLGVSAYQSEAPRFGAELDDESVENIRRALGGQLQPIPTTRLRWYLADLETAQQAADAGNLTQAARLHNAMRRDGVLTGLANTRTDGLVRLPKRFYGDEGLADELRALNGSRSVFDEMVPPSELAMLDWDGIDLGVGVAELVPVDGRDYPVMVRLDPEFLTYRWVENRWYYSSIAGILPITPGDGRWVLHVPGGRIGPWRAGLWPALGKSFINKDHAMQHRANYSAKLANPARVAYAPIGAAEPQRKGFLKMVMAWAVNSVFEMPPGWDVKLLESKGEGWKVFQDEIDTCNKEFMVTLAGQEVTTTGGTGFSNQDVQKVIRQDLIAADAEKLGYTCNTQVIPQFTVMRRGIEGLEKPAFMQWAVGSPKDLKAEGETLNQVAQGLTQLIAVFGQLGLDVNIEQLAERFGIPLREGTPNLSVVPSSERAVTPKPPTESTPEGKAKADEIVKKAA
jgi:molybdopterin biosynthesis enzyme MoaB